MMISQKVRIDFFEGEARKILRTELLKISSFFEMKSHADRTLVAVSQLFAIGFKNGNCDFVQENDMEMIFPQTLAGKFAFVSERNHLLTSSP